MSQISSSLSALTQKLKIHIGLIHLWIQDYAATNNSILNDQIKVVYDKVINEQCPLCPMQMASRYNLRIHIKVIHENEKNS